MQTTGERGEFFHPSLSPFGYNETVAQEYYPLTSVTCSQLPVTSNINVQEIGNRQQEIGFKRSTYSADPKIPDNVKVIKPKEYSDKERSVLRESEDITKQIIVCSESGRPFRIIQSELSFYRKHDLPLPKFHPDVRNNLRMKLRPGRTLHLKNCDKCEKEMLSVYAESSETTEKIYCEECYKQEIYG
jgi:hypothetical protein